MDREEAIKKIKEAMPTMWKETKDAIETLVPELAESEDERIRKEIISFLKDFEKDHYREIDCIYSWIEWLEKHKED